MRQILVRNVKGVLQVRDHPKAAQQLVLIASSANMGLEQRHAKHAQKDRSPMCSLPQHAQRAVKFGKEAQALLLPHRLRHVNARKNTILPALATLRGLVSLVAKDWSASVVLIHLS